MGIIVIYCTLTYLSLLPKLYERHNMSGSNGYAFCEFIEVVVP